MDRDPIVLVGMPRSGSTLCTAVLNQAPEIYLINDAYFLQVVDGRRAWQQFRSDADAEAFVNKIRSMVIKRSAVKSRKTLVNSSRMTEEQLDNACALMSNIEIKGKAWHAILETALKGAAESSGKSKWGWNTPQDLYHIEAINKVFPNSRFIFMMREPFAVLKSFKNKPNEKASRRYHPLAQALAWKKAVKKFHAAQLSYPNQVLLIKYENLASSTSFEIERLNGFLDVSIPTDLELSSLGTNSSFRNKAGSKRIKSQEVSGIEAWLADKIFHRERNSLGYSSPQKRFSAHGGGSLMVQTITFLYYYCAALFLNTDIRKRVFRFLK